MHLIFGNKHILRKMVRIEIFRQLPLIFGTFEEMLKQ